MAGCYAGPMPGRRTVALTLALALALGASPRLAFAGGDDEEEAAEEAAEAAEEAAERAAEGERPRSRARWMRTAGIASLAGGAGIFVLSYGAIALSGAILHDLGRARVDDPSKGPRGAEMVRVGQAFFVPVVGPWLAFPDMEGEVGMTFAGMDAVLQSAGLLMAFIGAGTLITYRLMDEEGRGGAAGRSPGRVWARGGPRLIPGGTAGSRYSGVSLTLRF